MATTVETKSGVLPAQLDYKMRQVVAPKYKDLPVQCYNVPSGSCTVTPTGQQWVEWHLPTVVYNTSRSYVDIVETIAGTATKYTRTHEDTIEAVSDVQFGVAGSQQMVDLHYAQNYVKVARKIETPLDKIPYGSLSADVTAADIDHYEQNGLAKCNSAKGDNCYPPGWVTVGAATKYTGVDNYVEPLYSKIAPGAAAADFTRYRRVPLSAFVGTMLAIDREFYSPVEMVLRFNLGPGNKIAYCTTNATAADPATGATVPGTVTFSSLVLHLAVQTNQRIIQDVKDQQKLGGLIFSIPYVVASRQQGGAAGASNTIQVQLSNQFGRRAKRVLHTIWSSSNSESLNSAYDCGNFNGSKLASYRTSLDSFPIQDQNIVCNMPQGGFINSQDWAENRKYLATNSCITSQASYGLNWFHIDQWNESFVDSTLPDCNIEEGLELEARTKIWSITTVNGTTANCLHYTFVTFLRQVVVTDSGPMFTAVVPVQTMVQQPFPQ